MALPRYTRITRNGVEYLDGSDRAMYTITELSRAAMRDVARYVLPKARRNLYSALRRITGKAARAIQYWIPRRDDNGNEVTNAVLYLGYKRGIAGFYGSYQEQGVHGQKQARALFNAVNNNIDEIRKIEAQYLSAINTADGGESLIDESEAEGED